MRRSLRTVFACLLVALISFQPAMACNSCNGWGGGYYAPVYYYGPVVYESGSCGCGCETVVYDNCSGCCTCDSSETVVKEGVSAGAAEPSKADSSAKAGQKEAAPQDTSTQQTAPQQPATVESNTQPQLPMQPAATEPKKTSEPAAPSFVPETPITTPAVTTPAPTTPMPTTPAPVTPAPSNPLPTPPAPAKTDAPIFDLPTEKPATPTPPAATQPSTTPATNPTTPATPDFFGPEKKDTKSGATPTTTQKPADKPAATESKPAEKPATPPAPDQKSKPEQKKADDKDGFFGATPSVLHEVGGLASNEVRLWTDDTGNFTCTARLVRFLDGHVRLLKENGRTTTVPLARLSKRDLEFVNRQASAQQAEVAKTAQAPATMPVTAN